MRDFLSGLAGRGDLLVVDRPVDPRFELAAVTRAVQRAGNQAVLFRSVLGTAMPLATNVYGSRGRLAAILGAGEREFCGAWSAMLDRGPVDPVTAPAADPYVADPHVNKGKLGDLPLVTYSEHDVGPYLTGGVFLAREPETGVVNLSFHRAMYVSGAELRVRLAPGHHLTRYHETAERSGKPLEAAMLIGVAPWLFLAAAARPPFGSSELSLAACIAGSTLSTRPGHKVDLDVPVDAEVVVEGRFLPGVRRPEGPFGEFMGYYVDVADNAVFEVTDVSWRDGALFHGIGCGSGEEVLPLGATAAAATFHRLSASMPGIVDVVRHPGVNHEVVAISQRYAGHSADVLDAMLADGGTKMCSVVDDDIDVYDLRDVLWAILTRGRPEGVRRRPGTRSFQHDPQTTWGRFAVDGCAPYADRHAYRRKRTPGADGINLADYLA